MILSVFVEFVGCVEVFECLRFLEFWGFLDLLSSSGPPDRLIRDSEVRLHFKGSARCYEFTVKCYWL